RMAAAHEIGGWGHPSDRPYWRHVVRHWKTSTNRDVRAGPDGDERNRPQPQRSVAVGRKEARHQRRPIESLHGRTPIAIGVVDAGGGGVLGVGDGRGQCYKPLTGANRQPHTRDGRSRCAWSEPRTDRATATRRKRPARRRLGTDWHTARLGRHPPHTSLRRSQSAAPERNRPRSPRPRLDIGQLCSGGNPGGTGTCYYDVPPRFAFLWRGEWQKCLGRNGHPYN